MAILLAGIGMALVDSEAAIRATPPAISLAFSPYAPRPARLVGLARETGHETLVSLPMEPLGYPLNDAGNRALLTGASLAQNDERLVWALCRISGYVGATAAMSGLRGERFAGSEQMERCSTALAGRGLLYIDPPAAAGAARGAPPPARPGRRTVDVLVDEPPVPRPRSRPSLPGWNSSRATAARARPCRPADAGDGGPAGRLGGDARQRGASRWCR